MSNSFHHRSRRKRVAKLTAIVSSILAVIFVAAPWVNEYLHLQREAAELSDLEMQIADVRNRQSMLEKVEEQLTHDLKSYLVKSVAPDKIESVREAMVEIVRRSGARMRRLEISAGDSRSWATEQDDIRNDAIPIYANESGFVLHSHLIELQADGSLQAVNEILRGVKRQGWLMSTKGMTISPTGIAEPPLNIELRLLVLGLTDELKASAVEDVADDPEDMAWRPAPATRR